MSTADQSPTHRPTPAVWWFAVASGLCVILAAAAGYLAANAYTAGPPPGCGAGSGCGDVLTSRWSKVGPVSVAIPAVVLYAVTLACVYLSRSTVPPRQRRAWLWAGACGGAMLAAPAWFGYLQHVEIGTFCVYCMTAHGIGLALAAWLVLGAMLSRQPRFFAGLPIGIAMVGLLAVAQVYTPGPVHRVDVPTDRDYDFIDGLGRRVGVLGGQLQLDLSEQIVIGDPNARQVLVVMFDHACPHCRKAHAALDAVRAQRGDGLAIVLMPVPLNNNCNPKTFEPLPRFEESCERSRLAIAVWVADASKVDAFDRWMFAAPQDPGYRTLAEARRQAEALVGKETLAQALQDPRIDPMIQFNTESFQRIGGYGVPILATPGAKAICCRIEDPNAIAGLLDAGLITMYTNQTATPAKP